MRVRLAALICAGLLVTCGQAHASGETDLKTTIWSEDKLWLLSASGQLFSIAKEDTAPRLEYAGDKVLGICAKKGVVQALVDTGDYPETWQLRHRENGAWVDDLSMPGTSADYNDESKVDRFVALICNGEDISIVTEKRLLTAEAGKTSTVSLSNNVGGNVAVALSTSQDIYLGYNHGEWGGGLRAIDRVSGAVTRIEDEPENCRGGALNTQCDPVNGLVPSPWHADCIVAAIGLIHMAPHGRVVEICGGKINRVFFKNYAKDMFGMPAKPPEDPSEEDFQTIAFYGLTMLEDGVLAVGMDGLYRLHGDGTADFEALPDFKDVPPYAVNFDNPQVALVLSSFNARHAVGWMTPMVAAKN